MQVIVNASDYSPALFCRDYQNPGESILAIDALCVVGRCYSYRGPDGQWKCFDSVDQHNEIVGLIAGIINTLTKKRNRYVDRVPGEYFLL